MKSFHYTIQDALGIHARPAGMLAKQAKEFQSKLHLTCNGKTAEISKLIALMGLGIRCGDTVTVTVEGPDEQEAAERMKQWFSEHL